MKKIIFVLLLVTVFVSACGDDGNVVTNEGPFVGGSEGVAVSFVEGAPFGEFVAGQDIPVKLLLKNNGEHDLAEGSIEAKLFGVHLPSFSLDAGWAVVNSPLIGVKKGFLEEGSEKIVDMGVLNYVAEINNPVETTLYSKICYPYRTSASVDICVSSKEIEDSGGEIVCDIAEDKLVEGGVSSGPVQLASFSEEFEGVNRLAFKLTFENQGVGQVFSKDSLCESVDTVEGNLEEDKVYLTMPEDITCFFIEGDESNEGYVRVGGNTVTCHMDVENTGSTYERNINILADYKYVESTSVGLTILEV